MTEATGPAPGIYPGVPFAVYLSWPHADFSFLTNFRKSAAHARHRLLVPREPTPALELGHATHRAVLEPDKFDDYYVVQPVDPTTGKAEPRRSNAAKQRWAEFVAANAGRDVLTPGQFAECMAMRDAAWSNPDVAAVLRAAVHRELSFVWIDEKTGRLLKGRSDLVSSLAGFSLVGDLKTSRDADPHWFARDVLNYGYHAQGAMYIDGLNALAPHDRQYHFIVIESDEPYVAVRYQLDADSIEQGRITYRKWLDTLVECEASGNWPGYRSGLISIPHWGFKAAGE